MPVDTFPLGGSLRENAFAVITTVELFKALGHKRDAVAIARSVFLPGPQPDLVWRESIVAHITGEDGRAVYEILIPKKLVSGGGSLRADDCRAARSFAAGGAASTPPSTLSTPQENERTVH